MAYLANEDFEKALLDAEEAIKLNPDFIKGYYRKGAALRQMDRIDEAISFLKEKAPAKAREDETIKKLLEDLAIEYKEDNLLPQGNPILHHQVL